VKESKQMKIINIFDAVKEGSYNEFEKLYKGDINQVNEFSKLNLLQTLLLDSNNPLDRFKIIESLIERGIDIHYKDSKNQRNALHVLYFNFLRGDVEYLLEITKILVKAGINVNEIDKYKVIPLKYALTICKLPTDEMCETYNYMLKAGSDYKLKDTLGKSCIDYANELTWRSGFIRIVEEFENDK
jgi:uncharacterized protein